MNKIKIISISSLLFICSYSYSQINDSTWKFFIKSDFFKEKIVPFIEKEGEQVYIVKTNDTLISDLCFKNMLTNDNYIINEIGIWKVGIKSTEPAYYLLFKIKNKYFFERKNIGNIIKRFQKFSRILKLTEKEKITLLYNISIFLNEVYDYPINIKTK